MGDTFIGIDYGRKRIGFAFGIKSIGIVTPIKNEMSTGVLDKDIDLVLYLAKERNVDGIVVGIPKRYMNYSKEDVDTSLHPAKIFLDKLISSTSMSVYSIDESLTTKQAETRLWELGVKASRRKKSLDAQSACLILERFFDEYGN